MNGSTKGTNIEAAPEESQTEDDQSANEMETIRVDGASYRIIAMDGHDLHEPEMLEHYKFLMGAGQRYDLLFEMPRKVKLSSRVNQV